MDTTVDAKAVALLEDALHRLNSGGRHWVKGNYSTTVLIDGKLEPAHCSAGAIYAAVDATGEPSLSNRGSGKAFEALSKAIDPSREWSFPVGVIVSWNDRPETTWGDVRNAFRRAITLVKKGKV